MMKREIHPDEAALEAKFREVLVLFKTVVGNQVANSNCNKYVEYVEELKKFNQNVGYYMKDVQEYERKYAHLSGLVNEVEGKLRAAEQQEVTLTPQTLRKRGGGEQTLRASRSGSVSMILGQLGDVVDAQKAQRVELMELRNELKQLKKPTPPLLPQEKNDLSLVAAQINIITKGKPLTIPEASYLREKLQAALEDKKSLNHGSLGHAERNMEKEVKNLTDSLGSAKASIEEDKSAVSQRESSLRLNE